MLNVLVIDDTKSVHAFVRNMLQKAPQVTNQHSPSVIMTSVYNGQEALDLLNSGKSFDLIFLDWEMPILDGPSTFAEFNKQGIKIPTIMMTTKNTFEDISKMLGMGVSEYLMKPFTIDILFEKINSVTGQDVPYVA